MKEFAERFALASFADGGVLVDLKSGAIHRLNATAVEMSTGLIEEGALEAVVERLGRRWPVNREVLQGDVEAFAARLAGGAVDEVRVGRAESQGGLSWTNEADGTAVLSVDGVQCARFAASTLQIELLEGVAKYGLEATLQWVAPHALMAQGWYVFHASAVRVDPHAVDVFVGASGAGKTTLARALVSAGCKGVSEDLVVVDMCGGLSIPAAVLVDGESQIRTWVTEWTRAAQRAHIDARVFASTSVAKLERLALRRILMLDADERSRESFEYAKLRSVDACAALLLNSFAEVANQQIWRLALCAAANFARHEIIGRLRVPSGLDALTKASRSYRTISMS